MTRRRRKRDRHRRRPEGKQGFLQRHATWIGIVLSVLALVVTCVQLWPTFVSNQVLQNPILQVSDLNVTTKNGVTATDYDLDEEVGRGTVDVAAVSIVLRNSGEEPALINQLRVHVNRVWFPGGCLGGGPLTVSVAYDVVLPGDLNLRPRQEPIVLDKPMQFKVDGKALDSLAVTIGQERIGEAEWSWITAAKLELIQDNGESIETDPFVLMDHTWVDQFVQAAKFQLDHNPGPDLFTDCVNETVQMLEEALAAPGKKSPAISEFHAQLVQLGFKAHPGLVPSTSSTNRPPGDDSSDTWIAQLASLPRSTSGTEVERSRADLATQTGLDVRVLDSSDFASLTPGYWVIYYPGSFADGHQALAKCREVGRTTEQSCVGRYLSHVERNRDLICRFSDTADSPNCVRN